MKQNKDIFIDNKNVIHFLKKKGDTKTVNITKK